MELITYEQALRNIHLRLSLVVLLMENRGMFKRKEAVEKITDLVECATVICIYAAKYDKLEEETLMLRILTAVREFDVYQLWKLQEQVSEYYGEKPQLKLVS